MLCHLMEGAGGCLTSTETFKHTNTYTQELYYFI